LTNGVSKVAGYGLDEPGFIFGKDITFSHLRVQTSSGIYSASHPISAAGPRYKSVDAENSICEPLTPLFHMHFKGVAKHMDNFTFNLHYQLSKFLKVVKQVY
jgi:hypothetical protein